MRAPDLIASILVGLGGALLCTKVVLVDAGLARRSKAALVLALALIAGGFAVLALFP